MLASVTAARLLTPSPPSPEVTASYRDAHGARAKHFCLSCDLANTVIDDDNEFIHEAVLAATNELVADSPFSFEPRSLSNIATKLVVSASKNAIAIANATRFAL